MDLTQEQTGISVIVSGNKDLTKSYIKSKEQIPKYWERDYINDCLNSIKRPNHKILMMFLWYSGARISEAVSVRKCDIDFVNYTMSIRWLKSRKYQYRIAPLHPNLKNLLELYTATMKSEDVIFPMSRVRAWQLTQKYFKGHPHQLRHSFAVNWLRGGGDIVMLQKMLGHSNINTTMVYLNFVPNDVGKELLKIQF